MTSGAGRSEPEPGDLQPGQFRLRHAVWIMLIAAVLLGLAAPWLRLVEHEIAIRLTLMATSCVLGLFGLFFFARQRRASQQRGGALLFCCDSRDLTTWGRIRFNVPRIPWWAFGGLVLISIGSQFEDPADPLDYVGMAVMPFCMVYTAIMFSYLQRPVEVRELGYVRGIALRAWSDLGSWRCREKPPFVRIPATDPWRRWATDELLLDSVEQLQTLKELIPVPADVDEAELSPWARPRDSITDFPRDGVPDSNARC